jgi:hypothetical protein
MFQPGCFLHEGDRIRIVWRHLPAQANLLSIPGLMRYPIRLLPWKFHLLAGKRADHHFNARGVKRYGWMVQWLINFTMAMCSSGVSAYGK